MKGIVFKELYLSRKRLIISVVTYLCLLVLCVLIKMSALYGNLALLPKSAVDMVNTIVWYFADYGLLLTLGGLTVINVGIDMKSHWSHYQRTLPITGKRIILSAYIANVVTLLGFVAIHSIVAPIMGAAFGEKYSFSHFAVKLVAAFVFFFFTIIALLIYTRFRSNPQFANTIFSALGFVTYLIVMVIGYFRLNVYTEKAQQYQQEMAAKLGVDVDSIAPPQTYEYMLQDAKAIGSFLSSWWWAVAIVFIAAFVGIFYVNVRFLDKPFDRIKVNEKQDKNAKKSFFSLPGLTKKPAPKGDED